MICIQVAPWLEGTPVHPWNSTCRYHQHEPLRKEIPSLPQISYFSDSNWLSNFSTVNKPRWYSNGYSTYPPANIAREKQLALLRGLLTIGFPCVRPLSSPLSHLSLSWLTNLLACLALESSRTGCIRKRQGDSTRCHTSDWPCQCHIGSTLAPK